MSIALSISSAPISSEVFAQQPAAWSEPASPFRITDNIYYVGTKGLASYLIISGREAILLDATLDENVASIERNIQSLEFGLRDIKIIINSHAHFDHAAGIGRLKKSTGAEVAAMAGDKSALENGRQEGDTDYGGAVFPAVKVDRILNDGDKVTLGDVTLTASLTAGHTKGCTTWSMTSPDRGSVRRVVFPCSISVAGNILVDNKSYPTIVEDFRRSFGRLASMKADVVLPAHPEVVGLFKRKEKLDAGDNQAFVDSGLLIKIVDQSRVAFDRALASARAK
nr:subclass B3 metallo-beta-lactamase [Neorhizobium galegae]